MEKSQLANRNRKKNKIELNSWECSVCTFSNPIESYKCEICMTRKGTSTRKSRPTNYVIELQEQIEKNCGGQNLATPFSFTGTPTNCNLSMIIENDEAAEAVKTAGEVEGESEEAEFEPDKQLSNPGEQDESNSASPHHNNTSTSATSNRNIPPQPTTSSSSSSLSFSSSSSLHHQQQQKKRNHALSGKPNGSIKPPIKQRNNAAKQPTKQNNRRVAATSGAAGGGPRGADDSRQRRQRVLDAVNALADGASSSSSTTAAHTHTASKRIPFKVTANGVTLTIFEYVDEEDSSNETSTISKNNVAAAQPITSSIPPAIHNALKSSENENNATENGQREEREREMSVTSQPEFTASNQDKIEIKDRTRDNTQSQTYWQGEKHDKMHPVSTKQQQEIKLGELQEEEICAQLQLSAPSRAKSSRLQMLGNSNDSAILPGSPTAAGGNID